MQSGNVECINEAEQRKRFTKGKRKRVKTGLIGPNQSGWKAGGLTTSRAKAIEKKKCQTLQKHRRLGKVMKVMSKTDLPRTNKSKTLSQQREK